jgi:hypothetical protein
MSQSRKRRPQELGDGKSEVPKAIFFSSFPQSRSLSTMTGSDASGATGAYESEFCFQPYAVSVHFGKGFFQKNDLVVLC